MTSEIIFKGAGFSITIKCPEGASCTEAIAAFERVTNKTLEGMDFYTKDRQPITNLEQAAPSEIVAIPAKNSSSSEEEDNVTITVKGAGFSLQIVCPRGASCKEALEAYERLAKKTLEGMDFYTKERQPITDLSQEAPTEIVAIPAKNSSSVK